MKPTIATVVAVGLVSLCQLGGAVAQQPGKVPVIRRRPTGTVTAREFRWQSGLPTLTRAFSVPRSTVAILDSLHGMRVVSVFDKSFVGPILSPEITEEAKQLESYSRRLDSLQSLENPTRPSITGRVAAGALASSGYTGYYVSNSMQTAKLVSIFEDHGVTPSLASTWAESILKWLRSSSARGGMLFIAAGGSAYVVADEFGLPGWLKVLIAVGVGTTVLFLYALLTRRKVLIAGGTVRRTPPVKDT